VCRDGVDARHPFAVETHRRRAPTLGPAIPTAVDGRLEEVLVSTADVLDRHLSCFAAGDLDGIMADYRDDAVLFVPGDVRRGLAAIRAHFVAAFAEFAKPGASFAMQHQAVDGDVAFIVWTAETADNRYEYATDTFVVSNGRIVAQTFAGLIIAKE
jgi:uncharacterized protein (TIGR02246 family)